MSKEFLNSNKLSTLPELRYLLLEALDCKDPIQWDKLSKACKEQSFNFTFAFENTMGFLHSTGIIKILDDKSVMRADSENFNDLKTDEVLAAFIVQKTFSYLDAKNLLNKILNKETAIVNPNNDELVIHANKIAPEFPFIKAFLLNLHIARLSQESNDQLVVYSQYRHFFDKKPQENITKPVPGKKPKFFISYAHIDEPYKDELQKHFSGLVSQGIIESWDGRYILPGEDWDDEVRKKLEQAEVVLFLVSADFMASEYINKVEIKQAMERHNKGEVRIIPVIIRPCDFRSLPIGKYLAVPKGAVAISEWKNKDAAYLDVVNQIKKVL